MRRMKRHDCLINGVLDIQIVVVPEERSGEAVIKCSLQGSRTACSGRSWRQRVVETSLDEATSDHKDHRDLEDLIICEPRVIRTSVLKQLCIRVNNFVGAPVLAIDWYSVAACPTLQHHLATTFKKVQQ